MENTELKNLKLYEDWKAEEYRDNILNKLHAIKRQLFEIASDFFGDTELLGVYVTGSVLNPIEDEINPDVDISIVINSIRYNKGRLHKVEDDIREYFFFENLPNLDVKVYNGGLPNGKNSYLLIDKGMMES